MDSQKHISSAFDQDLTTLNDALQLLGEMAHRQFEAAINGLATQSDSDLDDMVEDSLKKAGLWGEVADRLYGSGNWSLGRPAAKAMYCPGNCGRTGSAING